MQKKEVRIDLKVSRRESGLLQSDLAHLLETTQPRISNLEQGKGALTVEEALKLTVIFGKPVVELFQLLSERVRDELGQRISIMAEALPNVESSGPRADTFNRLMARLSANNQDAYGEEK